MLTKKALKELKKDGNKLTKKVINNLLDQGSTDEIESYLKNVIQHGCISGIVGELIYYSDTIAFYKKYKSEINELLQESMNNGLISSPSELRNWDNEDPLAIDESNQNLLSWFAFEETCYNIASQLDIDI